MVPVHFLSRLVLQKPLAILPRSLSTTEGLLKQCGGGKKSRSGEDVCQESQPCKSGKKKKAKFCDKGEEGESGKAGDPLDMCSVQAAKECARKIEELQKQWEAVARSVERAQAAAMEAGKHKRASSCQVKPPAKPEKDGSSMPVVLVVIAMIAGIAYYLWSQSQEGEGGEADDKAKEEKKE